MQKELRRIYKAQQKKQLIGHMTLSAIASALLTAGLFMVDELLRQRKR